MIDIVVPRGLNWDEAVALHGEPEPEPTTKPWESLTRHDDLNAFIADSDITEPDGWTTMTIAEKKTWLGENNGALE